MRTPLKTMVLSLFLILAFSAFASAGTGLKIETAGFDEYVAAGLDLELGLPGIPLRPLTELIGWGATEAGQPAHAQAGIGVRFYLDGASSGPFVEAKMRYIVPFEADSDASSVFLYGVGYRIRPLIGGLDVYISATSVEHDLLPKFAIGGRIGF